MGLEICKTIRQHPELAHIPVIFLTARASETDRIVGLELGANDYIVKPFFVRELIARIRIQFRGQTAPGKVLKAAALELDRSRCEARLGGNLLTLTATEFRLLEFLMSRPEWCSAASNCWTPFGAMIAPLPTGRSTSISCACARRSKPTQPTRSSSVRSADSGTASITLLPRLRNRLRIAFLPPSVPMPKAV